MPKGTYLKNLKEKLDYAQLIINQYRKWFKEQELENLIPVVENIVERTE